MGQHRHNPTAKLAKEGLLPKRPMKISRHEAERLFRASVWNQFAGRIFSRGVSRDGILAPISEEK